MTPTETRAVDQTAIEMVEFKATDRCDRCPAQAYALARKDGMTLHWCVHHKNKHFQALMDDDWEVIEDYAAIQQLSGKPS